MAREGLEGEAYARSVRDDARGELDGGVGAFLVHLHEANLRRRDGGEFLGLLDRSGDELLPHALKLEQGDFRGGRGDVWQRDGPHEIDVPVSLLLGIVELLLGHLRSRTTRRTWRQKRVLHVRARACTGGRGCSWLVWVWAQGLCRSWWCGRRDVGSDALRVGVVRGGSGNCAFCFCVYVESGQLSGTWLAQARR